MITRIMNFIVVYGVFLTAFTSVGYMLCGKVGSTEREREAERQRDRETERQRDRETERQRDRETERHEELEKMKMSKQLFERE
jgi:hypothetical protein